MNFKGQHLGGFFALLAALIIVAHAVVPHHHHFEITYSPKEASNCEIPDQRQNPENSDSHCHAFNVMVVEKVSYSSVNKFSPENFHSSVLGINNNEISHFQKFNTALIDGYNAILFNQSYSTAHSLRAPPAIA